MSGDYLGMSDEDFLNANPAAMEDDVPYEDEVGGYTNLGEDPDTTDEVEEAEVPQEPEASDDSEEVETDEDDDDDELPEEEAEASEEVDPESEEPEEAKEEETEEEGQARYKQFFDQITAEFKANGKMMKVDKPEDIVRLMQMGANYNRKMAALKPSLKVLKMLEKNELLSEEKLSYLIDLDQKRPEAIAKLLADSKIDPLDVNLDQASNYRAPDYSVDEREVALDEVVEEIQDTPQFSKTINVVSKVWDDASKQSVANDPQLLRVLNDHMASGIYDLVSTEIEQERMLGRLNGLSDIEAYQQVGDAIAARGGFDHLFQPQKQSQPPKPVTTKSASKPNDAQRRTKRRAASPSKPTATSAPKDDFNPLGMSDEEYMKQFDAKFL